MGMIAITDNSPTSSKTMAAITINSKRRMNSGFDIPTLGYGVYKVPADICGEVVSQALKAGYRHVDCAAMYRNEKPAGKAILDSGIPREEVFYTSKVYQPALTYEGVKAQVDLSLKECGLGYIDLMLLHAPYGGREGRKGAWKALVESVEGGKGKGGVISVGQWEIHPWIPRSDIVEWCKKRNIVVEAYSPLARGQRLSDKDLQPLTKKYGKSAAQILVRWSLQHSFVPLPKSETPSESSTMQQCTTLN